MRRLSEKTGKPFKRGETRKDGFRFHHYRYNRPLKDGLYTESWYSPEAFEKQNKAMAKSREQNREKAKQSTKDWQKANPEKVNAYAASRRSAKLQRTPKWLTEDQKLDIEEFYAMAKELEKIFPWKQDVDHIIPLQGETVSGLNVPWNLQILPAHRNRQKSNTFWGG